MLVPPESLVPTPWKNGGGVTREVARAEADGGWLWRLSVADVTADGSFSQFPGLERILTVIEGEGIDLVAPEHVIEARLAQPVRFSGETPIEGRLRAGPIRDLNVIFDANRVSVKVEPVYGPADIPAGPNETWFLCLEGRIRADSVPMPAGGFAHGAGRIALHAGAVGVVVQIRSSL